MFQLLLMGASASGGASVAPLSTRTLLHGVGVSVRLPANELAAQQAEAQRKARDVTKYVGPWVIVFTHAPSHGIPHADLAGRCNARSTPALWLLGE